MDIEDVSLQSLFAVRRYLAFLPGALEVPGMLKFVIGFHYSGLYACQLMLLHVIHNIVV